MRLPQLLAAAFLLAAAGAQAQMTPKVYAPEDLSVLREADQVRVISREYEEQSGGRRIGDDQLEFYLDQVDSGWRMSDIRDDIARSLRPGGHPPGHYDGRDGDDRYDGRVVRCESDELRRRECRTDFRARALLARQLSRTPCVEGRNWGQSAGRIWVDDGCRAEFGEDTRGYDPDYGVTCSSVDDRYVTCRWDDGRGRPELAERLSKAACTEGRTWGWRDGVLWVDRGCRARFGAAPHDYTDGRGNGPHRADGHYVEDRD